MSTQTELEVEAMEEEINRLLAINAELLAALEMVERELQNKVPFRDAMLIKTRAAIAKARG